MRRSEKPYKFRQSKGRAISVEFRAIPGKRISTGCYDMPSAVLWAEDYLRNNGIAGDGPPTMSELLGGFFMKDGPDSIRARNEAFGRNFDDAYYTQRQGILDNYILPYFGKYLVTSVSIISIEQFMMGLKSYRNGSKLANESKNRILSTLRIVMDEVKRKGYRVDNPADEVAMMTKEGEERKPLPPYMLNILFPASPDERIRIWGGEMWAVYFSIFYDTGFRPGEIAALRVCDVYRTRNGLAISTRCSVDTRKRHVKERVKTTKKGYSERVGLLYWDTAELLVRYIEKQDLHGDDLLFRGKNGNVLLAETSNKHFKSVMEKMGFWEEGMVQYCLRHSYETDRRGDIPDDVLAVSMGHTRLLDSYDHQKSIDLIRRLEKARDEFFINRERQNAEPDVVPLEKAVKGKRESG